MTLMFPIKCISKDNEKLLNKQGRPFLSPKFKSFANYIALQAKSQYKDKPLEGDIDVAVRFQMKDRKHCDLTNLPKGVFDALNKIVWKDDRQIKSCNMWLSYKKNEPEHIIMGVTEIKGEK